MPYDAANRKDIRKAEKAAAVAERNRGNTIRRIMSDAAGREFVYNFLADCHIYATPFVDNPYAMYALVGEQNAAKRLLDSVMRYAPDEYILLLREANGRRTVTDTIAAAGEQPRGTESGWEPEATDSPDARPNGPDLFDGLDTDAVN